MALHKILLPDGVTELANVKSVTFKEAVNSGVDLRPGCVGSASIEVEVYGAQTNAVSVGDALTYYQIDKGGNQTLIGVFYAEPTIATKNSWKFVAYDAANKLNADFSSWLMSHQSSFPMTIYALVSAACTEAGVTLGSASWTLSTENVQAFYADGITCRQVLSYAAELGCKFVRCHSDGKVYFDWYSTVANKRIYPSAGTSGSEKRYAYKQDGLSYANYTTAGIDGVAVHPSGEDDVAYIYPTTPTGDNLLNITNNLLLTGADAALYNAAANAIYNALNALGTYRPATARLFPMENPFRAGDVVAVTDVQGVSFTTVIMEQTVTDSDATLTSTGDEDYADSESNTQKALVQLASDVVRINKLKVDWADIDTAIINYLTTNNVTAQNLTIVDANDNVLATFNANGITLGQTGKSRLKVLNNRMVFLDENDNEIVFMGDARNSSGYAVVTETFIGDGSRKTFTILSHIQGNVSATVNGSSVTVSSYTSNSVTLASAPASGSIVRIRFRTQDAVYHYNLSGNDPSNDFGPNSFTAGDDTNEACGWNSSVLGGAGSIARGSSSVVAGGDGNVANGNSSAAVCGYGNVANGEYSSVVCGNRNKAGNVSSCVIAGDQNEVSHDQSVILGGTGNVTGDDNQVVYGLYAFPDAGCLELVGNGTAPNSRSNARTLDRSGNEVLAGTITANGATFGGSVYLNSGWIIRNLPSTMIDGTSYYIARLDNSDSSVRGGIAAYNSSQYGNGIRIVSSQNGNNNGIGLYFDSNDNPVVVLGSSSAWRSALSVSKDYSAGDSILFDTTSYTQFAAAMRGSNTMNFTVPVPNKIAAGVTASATGSIIVIASDGAHTVSNIDTDANITTSCVINGGRSCVTVRVTWATAPTWYTANRPVSVQAYGLLINFS